MSIESGNKILQTDIGTLYTNLNTVISNYGGSIAQLTSTPVVGDQVDDSDINDLKDKVTELKNDEFLGTESNLYLTYSITNEGTVLIPSTTIDNLETTILTNLQKIKCRNTANNSNVQNTHGSNSHTTCSNTFNSNGFRDFIANSFDSGGHCGRFGSKKSFGKKDHGTNTHGTRSNTYKTNTTVKDILNSLTTKSNT